MGWVLLDSYLSRSWLTSDLGHYAFGIESAIGSSYNFVPQLFHQINKAVANNDVKTARDLQFINTNMFEVLFKNGKKLILKLERPYLYFQHIYLNYYTYLNGIL